MATILEVAIEMYSRGVVLRKVDLWESVATDFLLTPTGLLPPFTSVQGLGETAARNIVTLREEQGIKSIEDLKLSKTIIEVLQNHGCFEGLPETNQFIFREGSRDTSSATRSSYQTRALIPDA